MAKHACETFDFPLAAGMVNYSVTKKIVPKLGGTWQLAVQEAVDEARQKAQDDGETALAAERCEPPCERSIFVDTSLDRIAPSWVPGKKGRSLAITVTGTWKAGILCFHGGAEGEKKSGKGKKDD